MSFFSHFKRTFSSTASAECGNIISTAREEICILKYTLNQCVVSQKIPANYWQGVFLRITQNFILIHTGSKYGRTEGFYLLLFLALA